MSFARAYDPNNPQDVYDASRKNSQALKQTNEEAEGVEAMLKKVEIQVEDIENSQIPAANAAAEVAERNYSDAVEKAEKLKRRLEAAENDKERIKDQLDESSKNYDAAKVGVAALAREEMQGNSDMQSVKVVLTANDSNDFVESLETASAAARTQARIVSNSALVKASSLTKEARIKVVETLISDLKRQADENEKAAETAKEQAETWKAQVVQLQASLTIKKADLEYKKANLAALKAQQEAAAAQFAKDMANLANSGSGFDGSGGILSWPIKACRTITNPFGGWAGFGTGFHSGIDINCVAGRSDPVYAAADGKVESANIGYCLGGLCLLINHGDTDGVNYSTLYQHLSSEAVSVGQWVSRGQFIGMTGATGPATGIHLHFETWVNGRAVNPCQYIGC